MDNPNLTTSVSSPGFIPITPTNYLVMPFTPPVPNVQMPQSMVWTPMQQPPLVAHVTPHVVSAPSHFKRRARRKIFRLPITLEPTITMFIGNIAENTPDNMMRKILSICGKIVSWKRAEGFGFCEYDGAEAAMRSIKFLHDIEVGGKKLVVKVDAKAQKTLDQFKDEKKGADDSEENQHFELICRQRITSIITKYNDKLSKEEKQNEDEEKLNIVDGVEFDIGPNKDEKRNIICQEIGKFREVTKKQEEEKEVERKKEQNEKKINVIHETHNSNSKIRHKEEQLEQANRYKEREREEINQIDIEKDVKDILEREKKERRDKEIEEEKMEAKQEEQKRRAREISYLEKCKKWEIRENQKKIERSLKRSKNQMIEEERERYAKELKEFLKDYDDEKKDQKYYKGRELRKRMEFREIELKKDRRNRQKEKYELDAIREKIYNSDLKDPELEFAKVLKGIEEMYKPKLLIDVTENQKDKLKPFELESGKEIQKQIKLEIKQERQIYVMEQAVTPSPQQPTTPPCVGPQTPPPKLIPMTHYTTLTIKKRMDIKDEFINGDEEVPKPKCRKLIPLDYNDKKEKVSNAVEERNKNIRQLIERIPTVKDELFSFELDWSVIDNELVEKRIRPWINKKIIEYIGEPDPELVDFICSKVLTGSSPQAILDDVQMLIDEEAELFVIKMWKLLVYEVEVKKLGLVKFEENSHKNS